MLLGRCEFGRDDYSLTLPDGLQAETMTAEDEQRVTENKAKTGKRKPPENQPGLFDGEGE